MKKKTKPDYSHLSIPFKHDTLRMDDMEILNEPLTGFTYATEEGGLLVCSAADSEVGRGNLMVIPFAEIMELGRGDAAGGDLEMDDDLYVICKTTEGEEVTYIYDFRVVHY